MLQLFALGAETRVHVGAAPTRRGPSNAFDTRRSLGHVVDLVRRGSDPTCRTLEASRRSRVSRRRRARDEGVGAPDAQPVAARQHGELRGGRGRVNFLDANRALERSRIPPAFLPLLVVFQPLQESNLRLGLSQVVLVRDPVGDVRLLHVVELPLVNDGRAEVLGNRIGQTTERNLVRSPNPDARGRHRELIARVHLLALVLDEGHRASELPAHVLNHLEVRERRFFRGDGAEPRLWNPSG
mmetsp:Transcript_2655/g.10798  ORF Transcript_2655/g.10798 Transcript_2655/m.10798 type:complete len:241 (+) Transcript_2655:886-1608(+)